MLEILMSTDPDGGKVGFARDLFRLRFRRLRYRQDVFAQRFGLSHGMVKDQEQGRVKPSAAFKVLVAAIDMDPLFMARAAQSASDRWPDEDED
jgi:transcriptional regulator with XRE-family HTH domain